MVGASEVKQTNMQVKQAESSITRSCCLQLQNSTGARIQFKDEVDPEESINRTLVIRGTQESAQQAENIIRHIIAEQPTIITETVLVPPNSIGRIIGECLVDT